MMHCLKHHIESMYKEVFCKINMNVLGTKYGGKRKWGYIMGN